MKRTLALLAALMLLLCSAGAEISLPGYDKEAGYTYVTLGSYPQWIDGGDPKEMAWKWSRENMWATHLTKNDVPFSPILWRVLYSDEADACLLSEYVLFAMPMHWQGKGKQAEYKKIGAGFVGTDLCTYLNGEFLSDAFTEEQAALLIPEESGIRVSLATTAELKNKAYGMGTNAARKGWATEYAIRVTRVFVYRTAVGMHTPYWLRDQASNQKDHTRCIKQTGEIGHINCITENEGARPLVHLSLKDCAIESGSGTFEDPYVIVPGKAE
jgi:hypothetical protein